MNNLTTLSEILTEQYPWDKFTFGAKPKSNDWAWRYLTSCILVGGSLESNTLQAANEIFRKYPTQAALANAPSKTVANIIKKAGVRFHGPKADYIQVTASNLLRKHNGIVPDTRAALEALPGVGRHVASVILATVYGQNEFAVDVHVRRIAGRFGLKGTDLEIENTIKASVKPELLGHFSRAFVDHAHTRCGVRTSCTGCPAAKICSKEEKVIPIKSVTSTLDVENYKIVSAINGDVKKVTFTKAGSTSSCVVTLAAKNAACTCNGFRFKRKCKHIEMAKDI